MKCPKCGTPMRPSKKYPGYYLCDTCRKRYPGSSNKNKQTPPAQATSSKKSKVRKKHTFPFVILLVLILAAAVIVLFNSELFCTPDTSGNAKEPHTTTFSSNETGTLDGIEVKVLSSKISSGTKTITPSNENSFLLIEIEIRNTTDTQISVNSICNFHAFYLENTIAHSASAYKVLAKEKPRLCGNIEPNGSLTGYVCYEVPSDFDKIDLEFSYPIWYNQKIAFEITP